MDLKTLIARGCERHGSAREFAKHIGITEQSLSDYKNHRRACGIEMHARIANASGLSDTQVRDYVWGELKERLGKLTEKALVVLLFGTFTGTVFAPHAEADGPNFRPSADNV